ncbi:MAG: 4Fe-4S binding protein [Anaerolineae bacterium]|nr:4Fe-4S binding protein [Anaerolineae bacterium]
MGDLHMGIPGDRLPRITESLCRSCRRCVARHVCRTKAIIQVDPGEPPTIDPSRCFGCMACVQACPHGAIVAPEPRILEGHLQRET